jgi:hypothetical protein
MTAAVSTWLVLIVCASAAVKAWRPRDTAAAMSTYGIDGPRAGIVASSSLVAIELSVATAVALGASWARWALAGMLGAFALASSAALLAGRGGRPCACLGGGSRLSWWTSARAGGLSLVATALALDWLGSPATAYDRWLTVGLALSVAVLAVLAVAIAALAREVGVLRLEMTGRGALEVPDEGPALGTRQPWARDIVAGPRALLRVAIFTSEGCALCRQLDQVVRHVAGDPVLAVRLFDEVADQITWRRANVPGSPYAIAMGLSGVVLAKGTFNSLAQLESILATGRARERERELRVAA